MDAQAFAYWLHGWSEINGGAAPTAQQWQIINDHLDLVFNKVTPDRQRSYPLSIPTPYSGDVMRSGCGITPFVPRTGGGILISGWAAYEDSQNRDKIFITVSRAPIYDTHASYSFYPYNPTNWQDRAFDDPATKCLLTGLGIQPVSDKVYLVVDNALSPTKETYAYNMRGGSNHLTMLPDKGPGIINVGVGSPLIC